MYRFLSRCFGQNEAPVLDVTHSEKEREDPCLLALHEHTAIAHLKLLLSSTDERK